MKKFENLFDSLIEEIIELDYNEKIILTVKNEEEGFEIKYALKCIKVFGTQLLAVGQMLDNKEIAGVVKTFEFHYEEDQYKILPEVKQYINEAIEDIIEGLELSNIETTTQVIAKKYTTKKKAD